MLDTEPIREFWSASQKINCLEFLPTAVYCYAGTKLLKASCVRADDGTMVSNHYCGGEKPGDETLECNTKKCPAR